MVFIHEKNLILLKKTELSLNDYKEGGPDPSGTLIFPVAEVGTEDSGVVVRTVHE